MPTTFNRLAISVALASSVIAGQQAQAYPQTPIYSRPADPNATYVGTTPEGGTVWNVPIGSGQQPPLSQYQQQGLDPNTYTIVGPHPIAHGVVWVKPNNENTAPFEAHIQEDGSAVRVYVPDLPPLCPSCAPDQQPPLPQVTPVLRPNATSTGIVETNRNNIAANTSSIANHEERITGNTSTGQTNATAIADHDKRITDNTSTGQANATAIADHDKRITGNTSTGHANATAIADHDKRITGNTSTGQANATAIADHDKRITDNTSTSQANATAIADHDKRITDNTSTGQANATAIADHDKRITDNTSTGQANATAIADHDKRITDN